MVNLKVKTRSRGERLCLCATHVWLAHDVIKLEVETNPRGRTILLIGRSVGKLLMSFLFAQYARDRKDDHVITILYLLLRAYLRDWSSSPGCHSRYCIQLIWHWTTCSNSQYVARRIWSRYTWISPWKSPTISWGLSGLRTFRLLDVSAVNLVDAGQRRCDVLPASICLTWRRHSGQDLIAPLDLYKVATYPYVSFLHSSKSDAISNVGE